MQAVDLYDTITITDNESATVTISCNCEGVPCDDSNICAKAAYKFFDYCKTDVKGIHIDIDKKFPHRQVLPAEAVTVRLLFRLEQYVWNNAQAGRDERIGEKSVRMCLSALRAEQSFARE